MKIKYSIPEDIQQLIVSYITHSIDNVELETLKNWINANPDNLILFNQFKEAWILSGKSQITSDKQLWNRIENEIESSKDNQLTGKPKKIVRLNWLRIAASWIIIAGFSSFITWYFIKPSENNPKTTEYTVPIGSKSTVTLPDGSVVWLNAGSKLVYSNDFDQKERNVYLTGEAYFSVMTNKEKPFKVHTSDIIVRALGTKFNVKAYPEEKTITTTLEEGVIDIQVINGKKKRVNQQIKIKPQEKLIFFKNGEFPEAAKEWKAAEEVKKIQNIDKNIKVESDINTELYTSWKGDKWVIEGLTLKCLTPMLERRYNMKIYFADNELKHYKFTGILQNETIEQIMDVLRYTAPIKYNIKKDSIYLSVDHKVKHNFESIITTRK